MPTLSHRIRLNPTPDQELYFRKAAGTARFVYNWALAEWNRQYQAHVEDPSRPKPSAAAIKRQFNELKYEQFPWMREIHRDAHAQPFANLAKAFSSWWKALESGGRCKAPTFKRKGRSRDGFYIANDKLSLDGNRVRIPVLGWVDMAEVLRFPGKVLSAAVSRTADHWFISISVDVSDETYRRQRLSDGVVGVDLGVKAALTCSNGEVFDAPKPLKNALRRLKIRQRRVTRKVKGSKNREKAKMQVSRLHERITNLRNDWTHKITTKLVRENQAIGLEDLNVSGMLRNHKLARAIANIGFGEIRRQVTYKALRYASELVLYPRFAPSSKKCHVCGHVLATLSLSVREWTCPRCGDFHDRDLNAAKVIEQYVRDSLVLC